MKITASDEGSLTGKVKPYLRVQYGDDGNPEVETTCIGKAENGNTEVKTDDVICRLRWVLNGEEPRRGA